MSQVEEEMQALLILTKRVIALSNELTETNRNVGNLVAHVDTIAAVINGNEGLVSQMQKINDIALIVAHENTVTSKRILFLITLITISVVGAFAAQIYYLMQF